MGVTTYNSVAATEYDEQVWDEGRVINTTLGMDATALGGTALQLQVQLDATASTCMDGTMLGDGKTAVAMPTTSTSIVSGEKKSTGSNSKD